MEWWRCRKEVIKERAKDVEHYLKNTNLTLTEVAFTTGFASTSNLNDFCKAYLLDTPGEIRRKAQETRKKKIIIIKRIPSPPDKHQKPNRPVPLKQTNKFKTTYCKKQVI